MPVNSPPPGAPCWFELTSIDPETSARFLVSVFGWDDSLREPGPVGPYVFLRKGDGTVGALCGIPPVSQAPGSNWAVYFHVRQLEAAVEHARTLGAQLLFGPFEAGEHGRGAVLRDPTGAMFKLWQPRAGDGGDLLMFEDYAVGWVELATPDAGIARTFYGTLLGWEFPPSQQPVVGDDDYREYAVDGVRYGGVLPMTKEWGDESAHWSIYVPVPDVDTCLEQCTTNGGVICVPAFDAPGVGRIARINDPTGAGMYVVTLTASGAPA